MTFPKHVDHAQVYGKHNLMYLLHKFWARKPHNIVSHYVECYSKNEEIVLDPFSGSGVTALEAIKLGRKAIAVDLDPLATFVTRMTAIPVDLVDVKKVFEKFKKSVRPKIYELYKIRCPRCGENKAITQSLVISFVVECPHCQKDVTMAKTKHGKGKKQMIYTCPFCEKDFNYATLRLKGEAFTELKFKCASCGAKDTMLDPSGDLIRKEPDGISYWYPDVKLSYNSGKRFITSRRMKTLPQLFTKTNLQALSILNHEIERLEDEAIKDQMKFIFSSMLHLVSRLIMLKRGREAGWNVPEFLVASFQPEYNVWDRFQSRFNAFLRGKECSNQEIKRCKEAKGPGDLDNQANILIANRSALDLSNIPDNSVDYVFTDPPYGGSIQYFELDFLKLAWLRGEKNDERFPLD